MGAPGRQDSSTTADTLPAAERAALPGLIAFVSERDGDKEVYVVHADGRGERRLARSPDRDDYPAAASPDGTRLVVVAVREDSAMHLEQLWLHRLDDTTRAPIALAPRGGRARNPSWAPDGRWIVFEADLASFADVWRSTPEGGAPRRLTTSEHGSYEPAVAPSGDRVAFVSSRDGNAELYMMRADGRGVRRLTAFHRDDWGPRWSPDGRLIAFLSDREGVPRLFVMSPDGTGQRALRPADGDSARAVVDFAWSPDGRQIAYTTVGRTERARIWTVDVATGTHHALTDGSSADESPAWSPDGRYLVFASARSGAPQLHLMRADGTAPTRLTRGAAPNWLPRWIAPSRAPAGGRAIPGHR